MTVRIFYEPLSSSSCFPSRNFPGYIIFQTPAQILVVTYPPTCCLHVARGHFSFLYATLTMYVITLPSSMPPSQFTWHFHWVHLHPDNLYVPGAYPVIFVPNDRFPQLHLYVKGYLQINIQLWQIFQTAPRTDECKVPIVSQHWYGHV